MIQGKYLLGRQRKRSTCNIELQVELSREREAEESFSSSKLFPLKLIEDKWG